MKKQKIRYHVFHVLLFHDLINETVFLLKLRPLKSPGQLFTNGLFYHAGSRKPDQRPRLRQDHVPQIRVARADASRCGMGQYRYIQASAIFKSLGGGTCLCHLHQGKHSFLHSGSAAGGKNNDGQLQTIRFLKTFCYFFPDDRSHAAHHEFFGNFRRKARDSLYRSDAGHTRIFTSRGDPVPFQLFSITGKPQRVICFHLREQFRIIAPVKQHFQPFAEGGHLFSVLLPQVPVPLQSLPLIPKLIHYFLLSSSHRMIADAFFSRNPVSTFPVI